MGLEASCPVRVEAGTFPGKIHLNTDRVEIRGASRCDIAFVTIRSAQADANGALIIEHAGGRAVLELGSRATAEKWVLKIRSPKSLLDKLGLKLDSRVAVLGVTDEEFLARAAERLGKKAAARLKAGLDFIFHAADSREELDRLKTFRRYLQPAGAIWVISLKGKAAKIKDTEVMRAARAAGLVDVKVCSFSATHTALKLVIPKNAR